MPFAYLVTVRPKFLSIEARLYFKFFLGEKRRNLSEQSCHHYALFYDKCTSITSIASPLLEIRVFFHYRDRVSKDLTTRYIT